MQVAILAGGQGTRLRPMLTDIPKSMAPVHGRPFLEHQLRLLKASGIRRVVLCVGYLAHQIVDYFGSGDRLGLEINYSVENQPLGTGGALKKAEALLEEEFFVLYGDCYLRLDYADIMASFRERGYLGMMVVIKNEDKWDRSNTVVRDDTVQFYSKTEHPPEMVYLDDGLTAFNRDVMDLIPAGGAVDLGELFQTLIGRGQLAAYETTTRLYEIGSPASLQEFEEYIAYGETNR